MGQTTGLARSVKNIPNYQKKKKKQLLTNLKMIPKGFNQLPRNIEKNISVANFLIIKISNCCTLPRKHEPHFYFWVNYHFDF